MGKSIKNEKQYKALLDKGMSKEKAARIANASSTHKHKNKAYEEWTKEELYKKAQEFNIAAGEGRGA